MMFSDIKIAKAVPQMHENWITNALIWRGLTEAFGGEDYFPGAFQV
jgi:hypothetical protein